MKAFTNANPRDLPQAVKLAHEARVAGHTAAIAGVYGDEHNVFYERTDNRATPGVGAIRKTGELTVRRGNAVGFLPDDFHTIDSARPRTDGNSSTPLDAGWATSKLFGALDGRSAVVLRRRASARRRL